MAVTHVKSMYLPRLCWRHGSSGFLVLTYLGVHIRKGFGATCLSLSPTTMNLLSLPLDVLLAILRSLNIVDIIHTGMVSPLTVAAPR